MILVSKIVVVVLVGLALPTPTVPVPTASAPLAVPSVPAPPTVPPLPVSTPTLPPLPVSTPTLPPLPISTPSLPPVLPTATPSTNPAPGSTTTPQGSSTPGGTNPPSASGGGQVPGSRPAPGGRGGGGGSGTAGPPAGASPVAAVNHAATPFVLLPPGPVGTALAVALFILPALFVIWLLLLVRTWQASRQWRSSTLRLAVAGELGVRPRDLAGMPPDALRSLRSQLAFDDLTGVLTRPAGMAALEREVARARRQRQPLCAVFADIDGLKAMNDTRGHAAGSALIRKAAQALKAGLRTEDLVFRFGGDEFVCLLPNTAMADAQAVMDRIRTSAAASVQFSFGVAEFERGDDEVKLLARADERLYQAKAARPEGLGRKAVRAPIEERLKDAGGADT